MSPDMAELIETFRKALMVEHANDWDMDTISEAAHICARVLSPAIRRALAIAAAVDAEEEDEAGMSGEAQGHNDLLRRLRAVGGEQ